MNNFQKAEMLLQFAGEMYIKNRLKVADWANSKSRSYYALAVKEGAKNEH